MTVSAPDGVRDAIAALEKYSIAFAALRPSATLSAGHDLDLLVNPSDLGRLDKAVRALGWISPPSSGHGSHRFYVMYDRTANAWHQLDVVSRLDFGPLQSYRTNLADACLRRVVRRDDGLSVLHRDDAFWLLFTHLAWKQQTSSRFAELAISAGDAEAAGPVAELLANYLPGGWGQLEQVLAAVRGGDWQQVAHSQQLLRQTWRSSHAFQVVAISAMNWLVRRIAIDRQGWSVALLGLDGAGKSTVAGLLHDEIAWPSALLYMGVWRESNVDHLLRKVIGARLALRLVRLTLVSLAAQYHRALGRLVILDRYSLDANLPSPDLDWKGRVGAVLVLRTAPEPDRLIFLDVAPQVAFARKGELSLEEMEGRRNFYLELAKRYPQWVTIDAERPLAEVSAAANELLWNDLVNVSAKNRR